MGKAGRKGRRSAGLAEGLRYAGPEAPTRRPRSPGPAVLIAVHDSLLVHQPRHLHQFLIEVHDRDRPQGVVVLSAVRPLGRPQAVAVRPQGRALRPAGRGPWTSAAGRSSAGAAQRLPAGAGRVCKKHFCIPQTSFLHVMQTSFLHTAKGMFPARMGLASLATVAITIATER